MPSLRPPDDGAGTSLEPSSRGTSSTQIYDADPAPEIHTTTSSSTLTPSSADFPVVPQHGNESLRDRFQYGRPRSSPSQQFAAAKSAQPLPTRSDSLARPSSTLQSNLESVIPENAVKSFLPAPQHIFSAGAPAQQATHTSVASRSMSTSTRSSNPETFGSPSSHLSAKSSKSSFTWDVPPMKSISGGTHPSQIESVWGNKPLPKKPTSRVPRRQPSTEDAIIPPNALQPSSTASRPQTTRSFSDTAVSEDAVPRDTFGRQSTQSIPQSLAAYGVNHPDMPASKGIDLGMQDYGDELLEDETSPADQIIFEIMSNLKRIPDLIAAAQVNTGFYGVFCDRGLQLVKSIIMETAPAAWEYMETAHTTISHPSVYLRTYHHALNILSDLRNAMFLRSQSTLRPETMDGLMGVHREKQFKIDSALWRIWTFCELFGGDSGRDRDLQSQMAWLSGVPETLVSDRTTSFGVGNGQGLAAPELLLMAELWNALSTLLQESFRHAADARRNSLFAQTNTQYPEELYLLEWISHVMTLGLGSIATLASGSFEEAQNLGLAHWTPPREFGKRQAFLKDAVASMYRRKLQEEATAKAAKAGVPIRATNRALAPTRRVIPSTMPSPDSMRPQTGLVPRKSVGSGASSPPSQPPSFRTRQLQQPSAYYNGAVPSIPELPSPPPPARAPGHHGRQVSNNSRPPVRTAEMVSYLSAQPRATTSIGATLFPYDTPSETPHRLSTLSATSSQHSQSSRPPSSPPLSQPTPEPVSPAHHPVVDPVDSALALLVDEMGFSATAARRALAASDDGSGLNADKAIALLQASVAASSSEKIPVIDDSNAPKPAKRFAGLKAKFSSQPMPGSRTFGELRPTGKERRQYGGLSANEAQEIKKDVFRTKAYKEAFGDLFHGRAEDAKLRKDSASTMSGPEPGGGSLSPVESWSLRSAEAESISSKRKVSGRMDLSIKS